jgi:superfamily II DNA or RNA helicase
VLSKFDSGVKALVLVSPTGSGKTVMAAHVMMDERFKQVRCISHRLSINEQNEALLCPTFTPQEFYDGKPEKFGTPDLVIWEECHHSEAPTFKLARKRFPNALMLGLTATPQRSDGLALDLFEDMVVAAHNSELLLNKTIVPCQVDVPESFYEDQTPDLAMAYLDYREAHNRALIFCPSIEEAESTAKRLKRVQPYHCHRGRKANAAALTAFKNGTLDALTTVDALGEGIDVPQADLLVLGRRCENISTWLQYCGRILRRFEGKRKSRVLDCVGASLRHGSPTEDLVYSITGTGIQRRGGQGQSYEREYAGRGELKPYRAKFRTLFGWQDATPEDKRRQLGWLRQHAATRGYTEDVALACFEALFGDEPAPASRVAPKSSKRNGAAA